jgi:hypothetical protein
MTSHTLANPQAIVATKRTKAVTNAISRNVTLREVECRGGGGGGGGGNGAGGQCPARGGCQINLPNSEHSCAGLNRRVGFFF